MAKRRFIVQDRWCDLCSQPAALLVVTATDPKVRHVCSIDHGKLLIRQLERSDAGEEELERAYDASEQIALNEAEEE